MARLFVIDTETGGIDPQTHSILSFAGVVWADGKVQAEFDVPIAEPLFSVTAQAMKVNRINLADHAATAVAPTVAAKRLATFLRKHFREELKSGAKVALAGHNVGFDIGFLKRLCRLGGISFDEMFSHRSLDTASILRFVALAGRAPLQGAGLDEALAHFGVAVPGPSRHTALGDALGTAELLNCLIALEQRPTSAPANGAQKPAARSRAATPARSRGKKAAKASKAADERRAAAG